MASGIATKRQDNELTSLLITRCYKKAGTRWRFPEVNFSDPDVNINSCLHNNNKVTRRNGGTCGHNGDILSQNGEKAKCQTGDNELRTVYLGQFDQETRHYTYQIRYHASHIM